MAHVSAAEIARKANGRRGVGGTFLISCPVPGHGRGRGDLTPSCTVRDGHAGRPYFIVSRAATGVTWCARRGSADGPRRLCTPISLGQPTHRGTHRLESSGQENIRDCGRDLEDSVATRRVRPSPLTSSRHGASPIHRWTACASIRACGTPTSRRISGAGRTDLPTDREELQGVQIIYLLPNVVPESAAEPPKRTLGPT